MSQVNRSIVIIYCHKKRVNKRFGFQLDISVSLAIISLYRNSLQNPFNRSHSFSAEQDRVITQYKTPSFTSLF